MDIDAMTCSAVAAPPVGKQPDAPKPATLEACHEVIDTPVHRLFQMETRLAYLQEQLRLNSRISSKPLSSDGPGAGRSVGNRAERRASERNRGAQKGHPGSFRAPVDESRVDTIVECAPPATCKCGAPGACQRTCRFVHAANRRGLEELRDFSRNCSCRPTSLVSIWKSRWTRVPMTSWQASNVAGFGASGCSPTGGASTAQHVMAPISMKHHPLARHPPGNLVFDFRRRRARQPEGGVEYVPLLPGWIRSLRPCARASRTTRARS